MFTLTKRSAQSSLEFVHYFPRQLITADDMSLEQEYFREKLRRHNRMLHGWGVVCGCQVTPITGLKVSVSEGYVITSSGDEIYIPPGTTFDLTGDARQSPDPCALLTPCSAVSTGKAIKGDTVYLAVYYVEYETKPVRVIPSGCGYSESTCEYSRTRESFELVSLDTVRMVQISVPIDNETFSEISLGPSSGRIKALPRSQYAEDSDNEGVVLAQITILDSGSMDINCSIQRKCLSTQSLQMRLIDAIREMEEL
jgi:hypothetical protein